MLNQSKTSVHFTEDQLSTLTGPIVYILKQAGTPIYIGSSQNGLARVFTKEHHAIGEYLYKKKALWLSLEVFAFDMAYDARQEEQRLINLHKPRLNIKMSVLGAS